jgi:hypothetical protein
MHNSDFGTCLSKHAVKLGQWGHYILLLGNVLLFICIPLFLQTNNIKQLQRIISDPSYLCNVQKTQNAFSKGKSYVIQTPTFTYNCDTGIVFYHLIDTQNTYRGHAPSTKIIIATDGARGRQGHIQIVYQIPEI